MFCFIYNCIVLVPYEGKNLQKGWQEALVGSKDGYSKVDKIKQEKLFQDGVILALLIEHTLGKQIRAERSGLRQEILWGWGGPVWGKPRSQDTHKG